MKAGWIFVILAIFLFGIAGMVVFFNWTSQNLKPIVSLTPTPIPAVVTVTPAGTVIPPTGSPNPTVTGAQVNQVKIFLIALNDNGTLGKKVGCGDSVVGVDKPIPPTTAPLKAALDQLLAVKSKNYGQSGLYNSLYQSNLKVDSVSITDNVATIKLSGTTALGGECDDPRFKAQIEETALQFPTVTQADILINNKPIDQVITTK